MKILALEFSSSLRSVAVCEFHPTTGVLERQGVAVEEGERSSRVVGLVENALQEAGLHRDEIDRFAVGLGPGSYTGIRAALAIVRGWQLGRPAGLTGLSSVEILARQSFMEGLRGKWNIAIDAQRKEFYLAGYDLVGEEAELVEPLRIVTEAEMRERTARGEQFLGPDAAKFVATGLTRYPSARVLAELALRQGGLGDGEGLEPIYLRETAFVKAPPPGTF